MKDIRGPLRSYLLADASVSALVGGVRVHAQRLPQDERDPSVVYNRISEVGDYHLLSDSGLGQVRMQVDSLAQDPDLATQLSNAVYDRLTGSNSQWSDGSTTVNVRGVFLSSGRDDFDETTGMYRQSRDYVIWYGAST